MKREDFDNLIEHWETEIEWREHRLRDPHFLGVPSYFTEAITAYKLCIRELKIVLDDAGRREDGE